LRTTRWQAPRLVRSIAESSALNVPSTAPFGGARQREHGQILVLFAFVLVTLLLVSALAVDYGGWLLARRSYQNIADEAALAGSYQLTSPTGADCAQGVGVSKQQCARQSAWQSIKDHLTNNGADPTAFPFDPATLALTSAASLGVTTGGYTFWVASPPSDAGSAYTGLASSNKTVYVRVERVLQAGLSRIVQSSTTVGAWATAGRIPENFAILTLCQTGCLAGGANVQVAGTGSNLILESGDLGSNSYGKTSGNNASIAMCEGSATASQCSAYMHTPSQCTTTSVTCQIDDWNGTTVNTGIRYSALALPQVVDPQYTLPTLSDTTNRTTGVVSGTAPNQCYSVIDGSAPSVSMAQPADQFAQAYPFDLTSAYLPPTPGPVTLGASNVSGTVKDSGNNKLGNITMHLTGPSNPADVLTSNVNATKGQYTYSGVTPSGSYTLQATDGTGVYHQTQVTVAVPASGNFSVPDIHMSTNPVFSGTVYDNATNPLAGATVTATISGTGGGTWSTTTIANGTYSLTVVPAFTAGNGPYTVAMSATLGGYVPASATPSASLNGTPTQNFILATTPGTISGQVTSGGSPLAGVSVSWSKGATGGAATTDASGNYTITGATSGSGVLTASKVGYTTATLSATLPSGGSLTNQNFSLVSNIANVTGTVYDQTTGLPLSGVVVTATNGVSSGTSAPSGNNGVFTIANLTPSNPKYTFTTSVTGWNVQTLTNKSLVVGSNTVDFAASAGNGLWPANCYPGNGANQKGSWDCANGSNCQLTTCNVGTTCNGDSTGINVSCTTFDNTNRIRPGTYRDITIGNNECAWIDPLGGKQGLTSGQAGGVVYITDTLSIGSNAFLFGDGVTIILGTGAHADVGNSGGFVINYKGQSGTFNGTWRTQNYIGVDNGASTFAACGTDSDGTYDLRKGGFTTGGSSHTARLTWDTSGTPCYQDGDTGTYLSSAKGEIGMGWYLRGSPTCCGGHRFAFSGAMGFLFDGVLYGPKDDIDLGGQGGQAAAGQIVAWTLKYHGDTDIHQRYSGIEVDGPPYLIEPYIGE